MLAEMAGAYNNDRDGYDYVALLDAHAADAPEVKAQDPLYKARDDRLHARAVREVHRPDAAEVPRGLRRLPAQLHRSGDPRLAGVPTWVDGTSRKGGFTGSATRLDPAKVKP